MDGMSLVPVPSLFRRHGLKYLYLTLMHRLCMQVPVMDLHSILYSLFSILYERISDNSSLRLEPLILLKKSINLSHKLACIQSGAQSLSYYEDILR